MTRRLLQSLCHLAGTAVVAGAALLAASCSYGLEQVLHRDTSVDDRVTGLSNSVLDSPTSAGAYSVAVLTDVHFGGKSKEYGRCEDAFLEWLRDSKESEQIAFVVCLGDVAEHGWEDEFKAYAAFVAQMEAIVGEGTVFSIVGNHDLYNNGWKWWKQYVNTSFQLDTSFFMFQTEAFSWYALDTASGTLGQSQYKALRNAFAADPRPKIVLTHYPFYSNESVRSNYFTMQNSDETARIITLCAENNVRIWGCGHLHLDEVTDFGSFAEVLFPGFLEDNQWGLLRVDEEAGTVTWENPVSTVR